MTRMWIAATGHPTEEWLNQNGRWYAPVDEDITPPEVTPIPTPIDPADIRPGDVFRLTHEATCERVERTGDIVSTLGDVFAPVTVEGMAWHLVHRPDPDAEAVEVMAKEWHEDGYVAEWDALHEDTREGIRKQARAALAALREQGWVVRRAES